MTTILDLVLKKQLTRGTLEAAIAAGGDINAQHPKKKKTALCIAVTEGQSEVVQLLLEHNADPNIECLDKKRTALWYATGAKSLGRDSCLPIIRLLLLYQANPHVFSACRQFSSPLMNTVEHNNQKNAQEAAKLILRAAKKRKETAKLAELPNPATGQSALDKANKIKTVHFQQVWIPLLKAEDHGLLMRGLHAAMGKIATIVNHTVSIIDRATGGRFKRIFGIKGEEIKDPKLKKAAADPQNPEELKAEMIGKLYEDGLQEFYSPDSPFLETVINKAAELAKRDLTKQPDGSLAFKNRARMNGASNGPSVPAPAPKQTLSTPGNVNKLTHLSMYQPILFLDNSISMEEQNRVRIRVMHEVVERVLNVTTLLPPDDSGVIIRMLHPNAQPNPFPNVIRKADIPTAVVKLNDIKYTYCTPLGTNLKAAVLEEFVYKPIKESRFERPVLISIITDGEPNTEKIEFQDVLHECRNFLKDYDVSPKAVRFHLSQVGNDPSAAEFLGKIRDDAALKDIIYVATDTLDERLTKYRENDAGLEVWLMKTLLEPIKSRKDEDEDDD